MATGKHLTNDESLIPNSLEDTEAGERRRIIGQKIKELRESVKLTQEQLARAVNKDRNSIVRYETGEASPTFETVQKIAASCKINSAYFSIGRTKEEFLEIMNHVDVADQISELPSDYQAIMKAGIRAMLDEYKDLERKRKKSLFGAE